MSDLVRMAKPGFAVRWVPREAVRSMLQNGWKTSPLDTPTSESEQVEPAPDGSSQSESPPKRRRGSKPEQEEGS